MSSNLLIFIKYLTTAIGLGIKVLVVLNIWNILAFWLPEFWVCLFLNAQHLVWHLSLTSDLTQNPAPAFTHIPSPPLLRWLDSSKKQEDARKMEMFLAFLVKSVGGSDNEEGERRLLDEGRGRARGRGGVPVNESRSQRSQPATAHSHIT